MSCLGDLERGRGISGKGIWQVMFAGGFGVFPRQDILAGLLGGSVWRVKWAHLFNRFEKQGKQAVEQKEIEKNEMYHGESVDCDIIM